MAFQIAKSRVTNDVDLLLGLGFEVCVAYVGSPRIELVKLGDEDYKAQAPEGNNSRVYSLYWSVREVATCN